MAISLRSGYRYHYVVFAGCRYCIINNKKMTKRLFCAALFCLVALCNSCKSDPEEKVEPIVGLHINEVYSGNPDWIEIYNDLDNDVNISGFILQDDKGAAEEYIIPEGTVVAAKSYLVLEAFSFGISSSNGDELVLLDNNGTQLDKVIIPAMGDGQSYGRVTNGAKEWKIFDKPTKGIDNATVIEEPEENNDLELFINEVYSSNPDWIELYNASDKEIDLSGYILQDDKGVNEEYKIPVGTKISAKSYIVFNEGIDFGFGLSSTNGDKVVLLDLKLSIVDEADIPNMEDGKSYGRVIDGADEWKIFDRPTKGMDNATEIEPDPEPDPVDPALFEDIILTEICGEQKYVEIYNKGSEEVSLVGLILERNEGASSYSFTLTDVIPAGAYRLILFNSHPEELEANDAYVGWDVSSGISDQQTLSIQLITVSSDVISSFQRGVAAWGTSGAERERDYSYSRQDDGTWAYADYTPGAANGEKVKEIVGPGYTAQ